MSGADVVAIIAEARSFMAASHPNYDTADKLARAEAAIAELIAADEEYDAAKSELMAATIEGECWQALRRRLRAAEKRRSAALAACKPARGAEGDSYA